MASVAQPGGNQLRGSASRYREDAKCERDGCTHYHRVLPPEAWSTERDNSIDCEPDIRGRVFGAAF
jgi:hypothetical protein